MTDNSKPEKSGTEHRVEETAAPGNKVLVSSLTKAAAAKVGGHRVHVPAARIVIMSRTA